MSTYNNPFPDVPSGSKMYRIFNCPPSHKMERHAKDYSDTKDAGKGNQVHDILAGEANEDESPFDAVKTAEMCDEQEKKLLAEWQGDGENPTEFREIRYALTDHGRVVVARPNLLANVVFTGQFDALYIQNRRCQQCQGSGAIMYDGEAMNCHNCDGVGIANNGLLIDFKALHGRHPHALENPQLASLAVLAFIKHDLHTLRVAIIQPWKGKPTKADYHFFSFLEAKDWLDRTLAAELKSTLDDRKAGDWCNHCAARFGCQTFRDAQLQEIERIDPMTIAGMDGATQAAAMWARANELSPEQHIAAYNGLAMVKRYAHAIEASFKARVEAGEIPGYTTREKKGRRSISDVGKVFASCAAHGVTADAFTAECSIGLGSVKELLRDATQKKGKALDKLSDEVLTGCVETGKGSLEIVKVGQLE